MSQRRRARPLVAVAGCFALAFACAPIEGVPLSRAPVNTCPERACEAYVSRDRTKAQCNDGRCEVGVGVPSYPLTVVVNVPDTSFYAPGRTFVMTRDELVPPAGTPVPRLCVPPRCVQLPVLVTGEGKYRVTSQAAADVGFPRFVPEGTSLPVRVSFVRLVGTTGSVAASSLGLPVDTSFASSRIIQRAGVAPEILYNNAVAVGRYLRIASPEPPYDAYFPPVADQLSVGEAFIDELTLGDAKTPLDDAAGDLRRAIVTRAEGLDGWRTWLADSDTGQRLSPIRPLSGTKSTVRLDTVGQTAPGSSGALRDGVDIVVAPPEGSLGLPTLQSRLLLTGSDLGTTEVPPIPAPASVSGVVAVESNGVLNGVPSRLTFTSTSLRVTNAPERSFLRYESFVSTDDSGRFATVLPLGTYEVTMEPLEGTGYAKTRPAKALEVTKSTTNERLVPLPRTKTVGRVLLTDGRPLADAEVRAVPSARQAKGLVAPRPGRARVADDGTFAVELDQGQYDLVVEPQAGSGFPRVITVASIAGEAADLGNIDVPPPTRLGLTLRDPNPNLPGNPIVRAMVRVFAQRANDADAPLVEIGRAMTTETGSCEILLAQQPR